MQIHRSRDERGRQAERILAAFDFRARIGGNRQADDEQVLVAETSGRARFSPCVSCRKSRSPSCPNLPRTARPHWQVQLLGLDVFDPVTMTRDHKKDDDVPAWMLDTHSNGMVFHADQVFFPRTAAWDSLRKAPVGTEIAVKVLDDRGNKLPVAVSLQS